MDISIKRSIHTQPRSIEERDKTQVADGIEGKLLIGNMEKFITTKYVVNTVLKPSDSLEK